MPEWPLWLSDGVGTGMVARFGYEMAVIDGATVLQPGPGTLLYPGAVRGSGPAYVQDAAGWTYLYEMARCAC